MITREEKNKDLDDEIKKEHTINVSKKIMKIIFTLFLIFSFLFLYMYFVEVKLLKTNEYIIKDNIPHSFNGIKILHFSDLLYGKTINKKELDKLQKEIKLINPDIVFYTGNLINSDNLLESDYHEINNFMKNIPYKIGKYAVRGDKDNNNFDLIFDDTNFNILDNELIKIYNNDLEEINIIGINSDSENEIKKDNSSYTITIINNYDNYNKYNLSSNLVFAGNNLGGEIKLFAVPLLGNNTYMNSYYEENGSKIYISNGLGSIHHMRFMNRPSINVYRLYMK